MAASLPTWAMSTPINPCETIVPEFHLRHPGNNAVYSLDTLAQFAAIQHGSVQAKRASISAAQAGADTARLQYWPKPSVQITPAAGGGRHTILTLEQPLWTGGRLSAAVDSAEARTASAQQGLVESQQNLALIVANVYQTFLQAVGRAAAMHQLLERLNRYRDSLLRRVDGGASAPGELESLQARHAHTHGQLKWACFAQQSAQQQLAMLIGKPLASSELDHSPQPPALPDLQSVLDRSRSNSPTLRRLEQDLQAAQHEANVKAAAQWPTIALFAQRTLPQGVPHATSTTAYGLQLQYTPGAGFASFSETRGAQAQVHALRAELDAAQVDVLTKVQLEHAELASALARKEDGLRSVQAHHNVLASFERLFAIGKRSGLDVMNAARELCDAQQNLADTEAQLAVSRYRLALYSLEPDWLSSSTAP